MSERPGRVQRRQQETKERIFRVAMELFQKQGFDNTTVSDITDAADIGKGTFFTYFPTKEAIFGHIGAVLTESMAETVAASLKASMPASAILAQILAGTAVWHEANRSLSAQALMASLRTSYVMETDRPNQRRMLQILSDVIRVGQERGEFKPDVRPEDAATVISGIYFFVLLAWFREPEPGPVGPRLQSALRLLIDGLQA